MVIRTYFDKNNTIVYNSPFNTGKNPVTELHYGKEIDFTRFLFHFDTSRIKAFIDEKIFSDTTKLKHTLKLTNTGLINEELLNKETCKGKQRTSSFDLIVFKMTEEWDEGVGYDYGFTSQDSGMFIGKESVSNQDCNWTIRKRNLLWSQEGSYSGVSTTIVGKQHFENGNENLDIDVTEIVNAYLDGSEVNYGLGIAYDRPYELLESDELQYVGFFTRHTQTFFEPFIETRYEQPIIDDRGDFYLCKDNQICLYSNIGGKPTNLDNLPTVTINDTSDNEIMSATTATQMSKGVYCVKTNIVEGENVGDCEHLYDKWSNLNLNGKKIKDVELDLITKSEGFFNLGDSDELPKEYGFNIRGINQGENVNRGDLRKVIVSARIPYTVDQKELLDDLEYRLYVKQGSSEYTVIDYDKINLTNNTNYFLLDTPTLIPSKYYVDIRVKSNLETRIVKEVLYFTIVNESNMNETRRDYMTFPISGSTSGSTTSM